jgi:hypothetical protein
MEHTDETNGDLVIDTTTMEPPIDEAPVLGENQQPTDTSIDKVSNAAVLATATVVEDKLESTLDAIEPVIEMVEDVVDAVNSVIDYVKDEPITINTGDGHQIVEGSEDPEMESMISMLNQMITEDDQDSQVIEPVEYAEIKHKFKPLDLLLFRGTDPVSIAIMKMQSMMGLNDEFSHAGVVVTRELLPHLKQLIPGRKYVWESTCSWVFASDGTPCIVTGENKLGVQIRDLETVLCGYLAQEEARVVWCPLHSNPFKNDKAKTIKSIEKMYLQFGAKKYENPLGLCAAVIPILRKPRYVFNEVELQQNDKVLTNLVNENFDGKRLFCSELVTLIYQNLGLIDSHYNPSNILPSHFINMFRIFKDKVYLKCTPEMLTYHEQTFKPIDENRIAEDDEGPSSPATIEEIAERDREEKEVEDTSMVVV